MHIYENPRIRIATFWIAVDQTWTLEEKPEKDYKPSRSKEAGAKPLIFVPRVINTHTPKAHFMESYCAALQTVLILYPLVTMT